MTAPGPTATGTSPPPAGRATWGRTGRVLVRVVGPQLRSPAWWRGVLLWTGGTCAASAAVGVLAVAVHGDRSELSPAPGPIGFGWVTLLLLAALLTVAWSTTARTTGPPETSRDSRSPGVPVSPTARLVGGWLASWTLTVLLVVASLPALFGVLVLGDVPVSAPVRVALLAVPLTGAATALASAAAARARTAEVARRRSGYAVATGGVGTTLLFLVTLPLVARTEPVPVEIPAEPGGLACGEVVVDERQVLHTEYTWPLLALSPFVVVADAAFDVDPSPEGTDPLTSISGAARAARAGAPDRLVECGGDGPYPDRGRADRQAVDDALVWPWGLGGAVVATGVALAAASRRGGSR